MFDKKEWFRKYNQTPKRKAYLKKYAQSAKAKATRKRCQENWLAKNPYYRKREVALRQLNTELSISTIQEVYEENIKHHGTLTCYICLEQVPFGKDQLEHKTPISRGGTHDKKNLAVSCKLCNELKHNRTEEEYNALCE